MPLCVASFCELLFSNSIAEIGLPTPYNLKNATSTFSKYISASAKATTVHVHQFGY
jgi:hypothetical protein